MDNDNNIADENNGDNDTNVEDDIAEILNGDDESIDNMEYDHQDPAQDVEDNRDESHEDHHNDCDEEAGEDDGSTWVAKNLHVDNETTITATETIRRQELAIRERRSNRHKNVN